MNRMNDGDVDHNTVMRFVVENPREHSLLDDTKAERLWDLNEKKGLDPNECREYRLLMWEAEESLTNGIENRGYSESDKLWAQQRLLTGIRDAVNEKRMAYEAGETGMNHTNQGAAGDAGATRYETKENPESFKDFGDRLRYGNADRENTREWLTGRHQPLLDDPAETRRLQYLTSQGYLETPEANEMTMLLKKSNERLAERISATPEMEKYLAATAWDMNRERRAAGYTGPGALEKELNEGTGVTFGGNITYQGPADWEPRPREEFASDLLYQRYREEWYREATRSERMAYMADKGNYDMTPAGGETLEDLQGRLNSGTAERGNTRDWLLGKHEWLLNNPEETELLKHLSEKDRLEGRQLHVWNHLMHQSKETLAERLDASPETRDYLASVVEDMNQQKQGISTPLRGAEGYFNRRILSGESEATGHNAAAAHAVEAETGRGAGEHRPDDGKDPNLTENMAWWLTRPERDAVDHTAETPAPTATEHETIWDRRAREANESEAAKYLEGLPEKGRDEADRAFEAAVYGTARESNTIQDYRRELLEGQANEESTTAWLLNQRGEGHGNAENHSLLQDLHDKLELDAREIRAYAYLLHEAMRSLIEELEAQQRQQGYVQNSEREERLSEYLAEAVKHMIQSKWMDEPPERHAEEILNGVQETTAQATGGGAGEEKQSTWSRLKGMFNRNG